MQAIAHHAAGGAAPAGANRDAAALGKADKVRNNEEIVHKTHFVNHIQLVIQLIMHLRPVGEALLKALLTEHAEVGIAVALPLRQLEAGQVVVAELKIEVAAPGDVHGVVRRFRQLREQGAHLLLALEVQLLALKAHPGRVVHGFAHLDAHQHILIIGVLFFDVVGVVGKGQGDTRLPVKADQALGGLLLLPQAVVLNLQIEVAGAEKLPQLQGLGPGLLVSVSDQQLGDGSCHAAGEADQPLAMLVQQGPVNAGLDIKALGKGGGHQVA